MTCRRRDAQSHGHVERPQIVRGHIADAKAEAVLPRLEFQFLVDWNSRCQCDLILLRRQIEFEYSGGLRRRGDLLRAVFQSDEQNQKLRMAFAVGRRGETCIGRVQKRIDPQRTMLRVGKLYSRSEAPALWTPESRAAERYANP